MNRNSFRAIDIAICISFPVAAFLFVESFALAHSTLGRLAEILLWILFASFIVLPLVVVLNVTFSRGRTPVGVLWIESVLAGAWLFVGLFVWLADRRGGLLIAGLAGCVIALTPYTVRFLLSSSDRHYTSK
jgi:hypothetical protein